MTRKRAHIRLSEIAASALADKLPRHERDALCEARVPAQQIISMFTPDHTDLHCFGGSDLWWNIDMRRRGPDLKAKDNRDTSIAAKAKRIDKANDFHRTIMAAKLSGDRVVSRKPKRKIPSRPFPKRQRTSWRSDLGGNRFGRVD